MNPQRIYVMQTDTTVGFLSQNTEKLHIIKQRPDNKPFLSAWDSFDSLSQKTRIPKAHRKMIRNASKTTFILPDGFAYRVVQEEKHKRFLQHFTWMYSTSANLSGNDFDPLFAKESADVIIEESQPFTLRESSQIIKLNKTRKKRIRT